MSKSRKTNTILIPLESYLFLQDRQSLERLGKHKSEKVIEKLKQNFTQFQHGGFYQVMDGDFGGCNGKPENAWEERRWTSWTCEDMKRLLDGAGLLYKDGETAEYINV